MMKTKRSAPILSLKSLSEDGSFTGYGSIFGNKDAYGDVVEPGAFTKSLATHEARGSRPKMFWMHESDKPIGSWVKMQEDDRGLLLEGRLNMDVQLGREAYALLKAGDIDGLSIGYRVVNEERDQKAGVLRLKELDLIEVSIVSMGANELALVGDVKHLETISRWKAGVRPQRRELEGLLKDQFEVSNSEAERMANAVLGEDRGGRDEPADPEVALWAAMSDAEVICVDEHGNQVSFEDL